MKKVIALLLALIMMLALAGCSNATNDDKTTGAEKKDIKIGIAINGWTTNPVFVDMGNRLRAEAEAEGVTLFEIPLSNAEDVTKACESFISSGCDGVIIQALYADAVIAQMPAMQEAGIAVSIYDNDLSQHGAIYNAMLNNYDAGYYLGKIAAEWANEHIDGEVHAAVATFSIVEVFRPRGEGIIDGLNDTLKNGSVVYSEDAASQEDGVALVENAYSADPELNLVVAWNGGSGVGCYEGCKSLGWNDRDDVALFSCDASQDELSAILGGGCFVCTMDLDLQNQIYELYQKTVAYIENGDAYPEGTTDEDKLWYFPLTPVYKDNAAEFVVD